MNTRELKNSKNCSKKNSGKNAGNILSLVLDRKKEEGMEPLSTAPS
jgi:hypothetical protein